MDFEKESPAFELLGEKNIKPITWTELKESSINKTWSIGEEIVEEATIIFKDKGGVLIRFTHKENNITDVFLNYFHFF